MMGEVVKFPERRLTYAMPNGDVRRKLEQRGFRVMQRITDGCKGIFTGGRVEYPPVVNFAGKPAANARDAYEILIDQLCDWFVYNAVCMWGNVEVKPAEDNTYIASVNIVNFHDSEHGERNVHNH